MKIMECEYCQETIMDGDEYHYNGFEVFCSLECIAKYKNFSNFIFGEEVFSPPVMKIKELE